MRRRTCWIVPTFIAVASCGVAKAVVYHPDGSIPPYEDWYDFRSDLSTEPFETAQGQVLASQTTPFEIRVWSEEAGRDLVVTGRLAHQVIRESDTSYLSFHYRVDAEPATEDITDFEGITLHGLGTWFTDFRADVQTTSDLSIWRVNGGNTFSYWAREDFDHWIIVRTNAPGFAGGGSFFYNVDWDGWGEEGFARLETFRPVPEPTSLLALSAAPLLLRRRRTAAVP